MKFICPKCNKETEIEVVMIDCSATETIKFKADGEPEYGTPEIHESLNSHYQCKNCGWKLPVEPNRVDDDALVRSSSISFESPVKSPEGKFSSPGMKFSIKSASLFFSSSKSSNLESRTGVAIKTKIEESTVEAPLDGVVLSVDRREGVFMSQHDLHVTKPSAPIVFGGRKMQIRVLIDERDVGKIRNGIRGVAYCRDGSLEFLSLTFSPIIPLVTSRKQFTGIATERVDVRDLHVVFSFDSLPWNCYSGEQLGVFLKLDPAKE